MVHWEITACCVWEAARHNLPPGCTFTPGCIYSWSIVIETDVLLSLLQRLPSSTIQPLNTLQFTCMCKHVHNNTPMHTYTPAWLPPVPGRKHWFCPTGSLTDIWMDGGGSWLAVISSVCVQCVRIVHQCVHVSQVWMDDELTGFVREPVVKLCCLLPFCSLTVGHTSPSLQPSPHPYLTSPSPICHLICLCTTPFSLQFYIQLVFFIAKAEIKQMRRQLDEKSTYAQRQR